MDLSSDPIATMGLRHVIEDGMEGLSTSHGSVRANFALERLNDILSTALRGAEMSSPAWHHMRGDMSALETYSKLFEYFSETYDDQLPVRIKEISDLLKKRLSGVPVDNSSLDSIKDFLREFLDKVKRDEAFRKQSEPQFLPLRNRCL